MLVSGQPRVGAPSCLCCLYVALQQEEQEAQEQLQPQPQLRRSAMLTSRSALPPLLVLPCSGHVCERALGRPGGPALLPHRRVPDVVCCTAAPSVPFSASVPVSGALSSARLPAPRSWLARPDTNQPAVWSAPVCAGGMLGSGVCVALFGAAYFWQVGCWHGK